MKPLHQQVPSPKALLAFEAAARHGSFTRAADELHVTQAAISYQVRMLEERMNVPLFERRARGIELTWAGTWLYRAISYGMNHIADAVHQIRSHHGRTGVTVAANPAVSFYWLRPKVTAFQREHPDIELRMLASDRDDLDMDTNGIDVAIRYGAGDWPGCRATLLFEEVAFPVCAPSYASRHGPVREPADLLHMNLLQLDPLSPDWVTWHKWFRAEGVEVSEDQVPVAINFNQYPLLLEAALEGEGVALGGGYIIDDLIEKGRLVRLSDSAYRTTYGYYLVTPDTATLTPNVREFCDRLLQVKYSGSE